MKAKLLLLMALTPSITGAQTVNEQKVSEFATAVAHAEGFGLRHALPTRYHNPGDIKTLRSVILPGQKRVGKGGHVVFKNDAAGWNALMDQISKMVDGRSKHFKADMTIVQVSRHYAGNWRPWVRIVSHELGVDPNTKLCDFLLDIDTQEVSTDDYFSQDTLLSDGGEEFLSGVF